MSLTGTVDVSGDQCFSTVDVFFLDKFFWSNNFLVKKIFFGQKNFLGGFGEKNFFGGFW